MTIKNTDQAVDAKKYGENYDRAFRRAKKDAEARRVCRRQVEAANREEEEGR